MEALESPDFIKARAYIYKTDPDKIPVESEEAARIVNFFHHWGLLAQKHYLLLWVFDSGSGAGVIRLYERTQNCIRARQELNNDDTYASNFKWLYTELKRRRKQKKW